MKLGQSKIKKNLPIVIIIIIALAAAYVGGTRFKQEVKAQKEMVTIIVATKSIAPYTILDKTNLKQIKVPIDKVDSEAINTDSVLGQMTIARILPNEQIRKEKITKDQTIKSKEIIAINVDMTRACAGWIQSGDIVDVWHLGGDTKTAGVGNSLIAPNSIVLDIRDSAGVSIYNGKQETMSSISSSVTPASAPAIAILVIDSEYTHQVINATKDQNAVMVKKFAKTQKLYVPTEATNSDTSVETGTEQTEQKLDGVQKMFGM